MRVRVVVRVVVIVKRGSVRGKCEDCVIVMISVVCVCLLLCVVVIVVRIK